MRTRDTVTQTTTYLDPVKRRHKNKARCLRKYQALDADLCKNLRKYERHHRQQHLGYPYQTNSRPEEEHLKLAMGGVSGVEHGNHDHVDKVVQHPH